MHRSELEVRDASSRLDAEIDKLEGRTGVAPREQNPPITIHLHEAHA